MATLISFINPYIEPVITFLPLTKLTGYGPLSRRCFGWAAEASQQDRRFTGHKKRLGFCLACTWQRGLGLAGTESGVKPGYAHAARFVWVRGPGWAQLGNEEQCDSRRNQDG